MFFKIKQPNSVAENYDVYYRHGTESIYNKRFEKHLKTPIMEDLLIHKIIKKSILKSKSKIIKILDHGCGDGRFNFLFEKIAKKYSNIKFEIISYDISRVGFQIMSENLLEDKYKFTKINGVLKKYNHYKDGNFAYNIGSFKKDNLSFKLVHGSEHDDPKYTKKFTKNVNITMSMFGVFCNMPYRKNRITTLKFFNQITTDSIIVTVVTPKIFQKEANAYTLMKKHGLNLGDAIEEGDFYYAINNAEFSADSVRNQEPVLNFGHGYTSFELKDYAKESGLLENSEIFINTVKFPTRFTSRIQSYIDMLLVKFLNKFFPCGFWDKHVHYLGLIVSK